MTRDRASKSFNSFTGVEIDPLPKGPSALTAKDLDIMILD